MHPPKSTLPRWVSDLPPFPTPHKAEEENMLHLDELIEQDAYEEYAVTFYRLFQVRC